MIAVDGVPVELESPRDASRRGIGMVHQHFRLFDGLTVAENVHAGWDETPRLVPRGTLDDRTKDLSERFGLVVNPKAAVWQLSVGEKQRVEILRILARGAQILILDEPTSVLTPSETDALFELLRAVKNDGRTTLFITHKLPEALAIADRISIMRQGRMLSTLDRSQADSRSITRLMVGQDVPRATRPPANVAGTILELRDAFASDDRGLPALRGVSLTVGAAEIVAVAGVTGNGQRELSEVMTGRRALTAGSLIVAGRDFSRGSPRDLIRAGVGCVPEDRFGTGLARAECIWRNAVMKSYRSAPISRAGLLLRRPARAYATELVHAVALSSSDVDAPVRALSGGNAQRLLAGREIRAATKALVLAYPTRGLDIQAAAAVRSTILTARAAGLATLLISEDLDEILELADRVVVIYQGQILGEFPSAEADRETVGALMSGVHVEENGR
jgi:simple sugar transport system ATP-binding protein